MVKERAHRRKEGSAGRSREGTVGRLKEGSRTLQMSCKHTTDAVNTHSELHSEHVECSVNPGWSIEGSAGQSKEARVGRRKEGSVEGRKGWSVDEGVANALQMVCL